MTKNDLVLSTEQILKKLRGVNFDILGDFKSAFSQMIKDCHLSVYQIAGLIAELSNGQIEISGNAIYNYAAPSRSQIPRVDILPIICGITGDIRPIEAIIKPINNLELHKIGLDEAVVLQIFNNEVKQKIQQEQTTELWKKIEAHFQQIKEKDNQKNSRCPIDINGTEVEQ